MSPASPSPDRPSLLRLTLAAPALAAALAILAPACAADPTADLEAFLQRAQDAACERLVECQMVPDVATCKDRRLGRLDEGTECLTDEIAAGLVAFDPAHGDACLQALRGGHCAVGATIPETFGVCDQALAGTVPAGGACQDSRQCADSGICGATPVCYPRGGVGDPCGGIPEDACSFTTYCKGSWCAPLAKVGQPCDDGVCAYGSYCARLSMRCEPTLPHGAPCDPHAAGACGEETCDPVTSRCAPLPAPGDDCSIDSLCAGGASCFQGTCVRYPGEGEPCLATDLTLCGLGLVCDGGGCVLPLPTECK